MLLRTIKCKPQINACSQLKVLNQISGIGSINHGKRILLPQTYQFSSFKEDEKKQTKQDVNQSKSNQEDMNGLDQTLRVFEDTYKQIAETIQEIDKEIQQKFKNVESFGIIHLFERLQRLKSNDLAKVAKGYLPRQLEEAASKAIGKLRPEEKECYEVKLTHGCPDNDSSGEKWSVNVNYAMAGFHPEDINVTVHGNTVIIEAVCDERGFHREACYEYTIPDQVNPMKIAAYFNEKDKDLIVEAPLDVNDDRKNKK